MLLLTERPNDREAAGTFCLAQTKQQSSVSRGEVATPALGKAGQCTASHMQGYLGADEVAVPLVGQLHPEPVVPLPGFVAEQRDRFVKMANDQVGPAIVIQVADGDAAALVLGLEIWPTLAGDVRKRAYALWPLSSLIAKQHRPLLGSASARMADDVSVADGDIFPAVVIQIEETHTETNIVLADTGDAGAVRDELEKRLASRG